MEDIAKVRGSGPVTIGLCFIAAIAEGVDLQSMAIAAPKMIPELHLNHAQYGHAASASLVGLLIGAIVAGGVADRIGRKKVLVASLVLLAVFTFITTLVRGYEALLAARVAVGLGLGGGLPILITIASEAVSTRRRSTAISIMYAGIPFGTIIGTLMTLYYGDAFQWRWIFYVGAALPLCLAPILLTLLADSYRAQRADGRPQAGSVTGLGALFSAERRRVTALLWISYASTLLVVYLMTNWLNQLMGIRGFTTMQAATVLLGWGVGSVCGALTMGWVTDSRAGRMAPPAVYAGIALSLVGLSQLAQFEWLIAAGFGAGFFAVGATLVNYTLGPRHYPTHVRATGVGWAVGVGRLGSIFGPLMAGTLLQLGMSASTVLLALTPPLIIGGIATSVLMWTPATVKTEER